MPWSAATAATAKCKRQFIGFARRRISTTVSPWTCSAIPKRRTEPKLLKPSTTSERGKKVPLMMLKTLYIPIILGSTRRERQSPKVARFIHERMRPYEQIETEILDLLECDFPIMEERLRFRDDPPPGLREFS